MLLCLNTYIPCNAQRYAIVSTKTHCIHLHQAEPPCTLYTSVKTRHENDPYPYRSSHVPLDPSFYHAGTHLDSISCMISAHLSLTPRLPPRRMHPMPVSALYAADGPQFCGSDSGGCNAASPPQYSALLLHCPLGPPGQTFSGPMLLGTGN